MCVCLSIFSYLYMMVVKMVYAPFGRTHRNIPNVAPMKSLGRKGRWSVFTVFELII